MAVRLMRSSPRTAGQTVRVICLMSGRCGRQARVRAACTSGGTVAMEASTGGQERGEMMWARWHDRSVADDREAGDACEVVGWAK